VGGYSCDPLLVASSCRTVETLEDGPDGVAGAVGSNDGCLGVLRDVVAAGASSRAGALVGEWASFCDARVSFRGTHGRVLVVTGGAVGLADVIVAADVSQGARIRALQADVLAFADLGGV